jgi:hypothetical protein
MVPEAGHYPQSQRPDLTTGAVLRFLESSRAAPRAGHIQASRLEETRWITGEVAVPQSRE